MLRWSNLNFNYHTIDGLQHLPSLFNYSDAWLSKMFSSMTKKVKEL